MKAVPILFVLFFTSCAYNRGPASVNRQNVARDSMASGNIEATAVKMAQNKSTCFDISLHMKGVEQKEASASNWSVAWVDSGGKYHLLSMGQRDPASLPQGGKRVAPHGAYEEWSNSFRACAPVADPAAVMSIILTPKELSYRETAGLKLEWR